MLLQSIQTNVRSYARARETGLLALLGESAERGTLARSDGESGSGQRQPDRPVRDTATDSARVEASTPPVSGAFVLAVLGLDARLATPESATSTSGSGASDLLVSQAVSAYVTN